MRADRLLSMLLLLQTHRRMTAQELAARLEVSERTIYRDMDALGAAGVPVYTERGPGGGCMLIDGFRTNLTGMTESEVRTLLLAGAPSLASDLGLAESLEVALLKLLAALPPRFRSHIERARQRIHIDASGWSRYEEPVPHLGTIQEAVLLDKRLQLTYQKANGEVSQRVIDPLGLGGEGDDLVSGGGFQRRHACLPRLARTRGRGVGGAVPASRGVRARRVLGAVGEGVRRVVADLRGPGARGL